MWNRWRYTVWAPLYDVFASAATDFEPARRRSIEGLGLRAGDRVLVVGAGTGLDLPHIPSAAHVTAIDITPAMLERLRRRAAELRVDVDTHTMDARRLAFGDASFDAVILHLVLAVMPQPELGLREAERVVRPGGRIAVFDKFLGDDQRPSLARRLLNAVVTVLFSDINRRLGPLVQGTSLAVERNEPAAFGGVFRLVTLRKPAGPDGR